MLVVFSTKKSRTQIWVQIPFSKVMGSAVKVGDSCGIQEQTYRACWQVLHKPQEYQMSAAGLGALWGEPGAALCRAQPILVTPGPGLGHLRGNSKDRACPGSPAFPSFLPHPAEGNGVHGCVGSWQRAQLVPPHPCWTAAEQEHLVLSLVFVPVIIQQGKWPGMGLNPLHLKDLGCVSFPPSQWMVKCTYSNLNSPKYCLFSKWMFYANISWIADTRICKGLNVQF